MLLNKLHVLDKGYVALLESSFNSKLLGEVRDEFFGAQETADPILRGKLGRLTLAIKLPLFAARSLGHFGLTIIPTPQTERLEAYLPTPGDIGSGDHETDVAICDDIARTTAALLINPNAYMSDGCDRFVAQLNTPMNVYATVIASGSYNEWQEFCAVPELPGPLKAYQGAIKQLIANEWKLYG